MLSGMGDPLGHNQNSKARGLYESPFLQGMSFEGPSSAGQSPAQGMGAPHFVSSKMDMIPPPPSHSLPGMHDSDFPVNLQPPSMTMGKGPPPDDHLHLHQQHHHHPSSAGHLAKKSSGGKKRPRSNSSSADNKKERKNNREKQRRSELNSQFESLMSLCGLDAKNKPEKYTILAESSGLIRKLLSENHLLKTEKMELESELSRMSSYLQKSFGGQPPRQGGGGFSQYNGVMGAPIGQPPKGMGSQQQQQHHPQQPQPHHHHRSSPPANEELDIFQ